MSGRPSFISDKASNSKEETAAFSLSDPEPEQPERIQISVQQIVIMYMKLFLNRFIYCPYGFGVINYSGQVQKAS